MSAFDRVAAILFEPATSVLLLYVVLLLVLACFRSQSFSLAIHDQVAHEAETSSLNLYAAVGLPVLGSLMLLALFFFLDIMFYFLVLLFGVSAFGAVSMFVHPSVRSLRLSLFPRVPEIQAFSCRGKTHSFAVFDTLVCMSCAGACIAGWLATKHWFFVDILATAMAVQAVATLRLPNLLIATVLLCVFFLYDVFWVFLSPWLFGGKSVMVEVAVGVTSGSIPLPMLVLIPKFSSGGAGMLGLGDIVLPGILLAFLFRWDFANAQKRIESNQQLSLAQVLSVPNGYFVFGLSAYVIGLIWTFIMLGLMQTGQPALLYLVPSTLGTTLCLSAKRGDLRAMWVRKPVETEESDSEEGGEERGEERGQRSTAHSSSEEIELKEIVV